MCLSLFSLCPIVKENQLPRAALLTALGNQPEFQVFMPTLPAATQAKQSAAAPVFRAAFFHSVLSAGQDWDAAAPTDNLFLQRAYLQILEKNPPHGMRFGYLVFYKNEAPIGVAYCQAKFFKGDDNIQEINEQAAATTEREPCFFDGLAHWLKKWVAAKVAGDLLILGNMLLTGEHGYHFDYQEISEEQALSLLENGLQTAIREMERDNVKMPVILVKDLAPERLLQRQLARENGFTEFEIQPNMVLDVSWPDFDGYLSAMSTKYRTRAKRAVKKLDGIQRVELSLADIQRELPRMFALYKEVAKNAGFNMVDLNEDYLLALKRDLPERFRAFAYYYEGQMVTFYTTISNGAEMEAHFLGYDKGLNHDRQLYLNALYDMVRLGIEGGHERIVFARTALEIKSSVGAVPTELYCYLRHENSLANRFTGKILDYLKPVEVWQQRHPFKGHDGGEMH